MVNKLWETAIEHVLNSDKWKRKCATTEHKITSPNKFKRYYYRSFSFQWQLLNCTRRLAFFSFSKIPTFKYEQYFYSINARAFKANPIESDCERVPFRGTWCLTGLNTPGFEIIVINSVSCSAVIWYHQLCRRTENFIQIWNDKWLCFRISNCKLTWSCYSDILTGRCSVPHLMQYLWIKQAEELKDFDYVIAENYKLKAYLIKRQHPSSGLIRGGRNKDFHENSTSNAVRHMSTRVEQLFSVIC